MNKFLIFVSGVAIGVGVSWIYHKNKYEQLVEEEVESIREHMDGDKKAKERHSDYRKDKEEQGPEDGKQAAKAYNNIIKDNAYDPMEPEKDIFVVTPEDFASIPGYDADSLYYHDNDIISNDDNVEVDNVEELLGMTILEVRAHFGEYDENTVYIRNALLHTDYEVLRNLDDFEPNPHLSSK